MIALFIIALLLCIYLISKNVFFIIPLFICFMCGFDPSLQRTKKPKEPPRKQPQEHPQQEDEERKEYAPAIIFNPEDDEEENESITL